VGPGISEGHRKNFVGQMLKYVVLDIKHIITKFSFKMSNHQKFYLGARPMTGGREWGVPPLRTAPGWHVGELTCYPAVAAAAAAAARMRR